MNIVIKSNGNYKLEELYKMPTKMIQKIIDLMKEYSEAQEKALSGKNKTTF